MKSTIVRLFLICWMTVASVATAETLPSTEEESLGITVWRDFSSPATTHAWIPLVSGSALTLTVYNLRGSWSNPLNSAWQESKPFGRSSAWGDVLGQVVPNAAYFLGMYADYFWGSGSKESRQRAILMAKATAYSGGVTMITKTLVRSQRPNGSDKRSFPSGHATSAFAFASVVGAEHAWYWGVPTYLMATFVGATRINDNMHRLHDVIAGATIGMSYGLGIYYRMHENDLKHSATVYQILPTDDFDGAILSLTYEF